MSTRARRTFGSLLAGSGAVLLLTAVLSNQLGLSHGPVSGSRILVGLAGLILLAIGILKRRFFSLYQATAVTAANTLVLLLCLECSALVINRCLAAFDEPPAQDAMSEVLQTSVARQLYTGWKGRPYDGQAIHVTEAGLRRTPEIPGSDDRNAVRIFAFGGSTMWGEGASDEETIAAWLQRKLSSEVGCSIRVTNFGQRAWVSTQSLIQLMLELEHGNVPDIVVFYDGYNETTAAYSSGRFGVPENYEGLCDFQDPLKAGIQKALLNTQLGRLLSRRQQRLTPDVDVEATSDGIIRTYRQVLRLTQALGDEYGFAVHCYWQPQLATDHKVLTEEETQLLNHHFLPEPVKRLTAAVHAKAIRLAEDTPVLTDISDCFSDISDRIYLDPCHVVGAGNEKVAEAMIAGGLLQTVHHRCQEPSGRDTPTIVGAVTHQAFSPRPSLHSYRHQAPS
ncbi:MAG: SGNH/GDSL hydrolase family protein [Planctomycetaceae bacterium]